MFKLKISVTTPTPTTLLSLNASLGEMIQQLTPQGINVPTGFATTACAYRTFIQKAGLETKLRQLLGDLDIENVANLRSLLIVRQSVKLEAADKHAVQ